MWRAGARRSYRHPPSTYLWLAVTGLLVLYLVAFALNALVHLGQPTEFLYGESIVLAQVRGLNAGQPLYPPPTQLPLSVTAYTPVYYLLVAGMQRLSGEHGYLVGRLVSLAAVIGGAALLGASVRAVAGSWRGGLLAGALFLTQNLTALLWAPAHRVDALALCLTLAGLALASIGRPSLAAVALVLAVMTKQTYLVAAPSVCFQLWPHRRSLLAFLAPFLLGLGVALGAGQVLSGGWLLWHTVLANANPLDFDYFSAMVNSFVSLNAVVVVAAACALALPALPRERVWRAYFVLSGIEALVTIGKLGASSNYWLELTAANAALVGILAVRLSRDGQVRAPFSAAGLAGLVLGCLLLALPGYAATVMQSWQLANDGPSPQLQVAQLAASQPGEILTDDPGLAVLANKPVEFEFIIFSILAEQHVWDERPILDAIASHRFSLVLLTQSLDAPQPPLIAERWTQAVGDALRSNYAPAGQDGGYWLYRPSE